VVLPPTPVLPPTLVDALVAPPVVVVVVSGLLLLLQAADQIPANNATPKIREPLLLI
jgi:hypothetical protein